MIIWYFHLYGLRQVTLLLNTLYASTENGEEIFLLKMLF